MFAWDDIAVFLTLYRERTTVRAAKRLGCSQPTIVRRIAAFEHGLGIDLFRRTPTGLVPTEAAASLLRSAEQVERSVCEFTAEIDAQTGATLKNIRLTFLDHFERLLVPVLRDFRARWPDVRTELLASDQVYDLARGEADIAIRGRQRPTGDELVVHALPSIGWTVFASANSDAVDRPRTPDEVGQFPLALLDSSAGRLPVYQWLESLVGNGHPIRCNNYSALKSVISSGAALSVLPCTVGYGEPGLVHCFPPMAHFDTEIFLVARRAVLRRPPARDLFDSIAAYFKDHPELMTGKRGGDAA